MSRHSFDAHARKYDTWYDTEPGRTLFAMEVDCLRPFIDGDRPWLEVGVGSGRFARALGTKYGVDPSRPLLEIAKSRGIQVVQGVGEKLPFRSGVLTGVLMALALCFVKDPERVLREAGRVLRPGRRLALGIILKESPWADYYARLGREGHRIYRNARFYSRAEVETMLGRAGFGDLAYRSALTQPPGLTRYPPESPVDGYRQDAGFTAIKALKQ